MIPNPQKTKAMIISPSNDIYNSLQEFNNLTLSLQSQNIAISESEKLLGVQVDHTLDWKEQIEKILKKCNSLLYLLIRIKPYLNIHMRKVFFNAYVLPHIDYCCTIWGNCNGTLLDRLYKFQKRAARVIYDEPYDAPSDPLFKN